VEFEKRNNNKNIFSALQKHSALQGERKRNNSTPGQPIIKISVVGYQDPEHNFLFSFSYNCQRARAGETSHNYTQKGFFPQFTLFLKDFLFFSVFTFSEMFS